MNVYQLPGLENERKLFGTETMVWSDGRTVRDWSFGDWNCDLLLLMQDAAPVYGIAERVGKHPDPFSAQNFWEKPGAGGAKTNKKLHELAATVNCRKLAGSSFIGILKPPATAPGANEKRSDYSGPISNCPYIKKYCLDVLTWAFGKAKNLGTIACMGQKPFQFASEIFDLSAAEMGQLQNVRGSLVARDRFRVSYLGHPGWFGHPSHWGFGGGEAALAAWNRMVRESRFPVH